MGVDTGELAALFPRPDDADADCVPLGTRLRGRASDLDIDPVEAVRELREDV